MIQSLEAPATIFENIIGFGYLSANRCLVYDLMHLKGVLSGSISLESLPHILSLELDDDDARPFEVINFVLPDENTLSHFILGKIAESHAQMERRVFAGLSPENNLRWTASEAGRIWTDKKILILKQSFRNAEMISIKRHFGKIGISLDGFSILLLSPINEIDDKGWGYILSSPV